MDHRGQTEFWKRSVRRVLLFFLLAIAGRGLPEGVDEPPERARREQGVQHGLEDAGLPPGHVSGAGRLQPAHPGDAAEAARPLAQVQGVLRAVSGAAGVPQTCHLSFREKEPPSQHILDTSPATPDVYSLWRNFDVR